MITVKKIKALIEEKIEGTDSFIVDLQIRPTNRILVELDSDSGATIQRCVEVSRFIEHSLDRDVEDFELMVTSPGLDQPLRMVRQYKKNIGRKLKVLTNDGQQFEGEIKEAGEKNLVLLSRNREKIEGKKGKRMVEREATLEYQTIKEAKIVVSFN